MRLYLLSIAIIAIMASPRPSEAQKAEPPAFVVIVHQDNPVSELDRKFLTNVFLKKTTRWSGDLVIHPVDASARSAVRRRFSENVLKRSVQAVKAYWQQIVFSGRGVPPPELASDAEVVAYVRKRRGAIGYVSGSANLEGVKVIQVE